MIVASLFGGHSSEISTYIFPTVIWRCPEELLWYIVGPYCYIFVGPYVSHNFTQKKYGVVEEHWLLSKRSGFKSCLLLFIEGCLEKVY